MMKSVYDSDCLSHLNIFRWYAVFSVGREDTEDPQRASKPRRSRTKQNVKKVIEILSSDRCVSARLIKEISGISKSTVHHILTEDLGKRKVCVWSVLHMLSDDDKHARVEHYKDMLRLAQSDTNFTKSSVTDETWCFQYEPLTKRQSAV
jgi:hypothetical protein